jgi:disulfide bond formation protein DsbB
MKKLRENVDFIGQKYIDEPVRVEVSKAKVTAISINIGLQSEFNQDTRCRFGEVAYSPAPGEVEAMVIEQVLRAHGAAVAGAHFLGYSLPEWAAIVTITYTVLLGIRLIVHEIRDWMNK